MFIKSRSPNRDCWQEWHSFRSRLMVLRNEQTLWAGIFPTYFWGVVVPPTVSDSSLCLCGCKAHSQFPALFLQFPLLTAISRKTVSVVSVPNLPLGTIILLRPWQQVFNLSVVQSVAWATQRTQHWRSKKALRNYFDHTKSCFSSFLALLQRKSVEVLAILSRCGG